MYSEDGTPNAMNTTWGGISRMKETGVDFKPETCILRGEIVNISVENASSSPPSTTTT